MDDCQEPNILDPSPSQPKASPPSPPCPRCYNLLQNPSFEIGLFGWETNNVITADNNPFEGTQVARLGPGVASMFQDVSLANTGHDPLFLSFNVFPGPDTTNTGNLVVEVLWLDAKLNTIATGLRLFIPDGMIKINSRITFFDITDQPPDGATLARLQFSKAATGLLEIDQVILTPVDSINLVQNPGFELGLTAWTATPSTSFIPDFIVPLEGSADAATFADGTLFQDVPITTLPDRSSFLLCFAASAATIGGVNASLSVQVLWLDSAGNVIGSPGLDLFIPSDTLFNQVNYLTYLDLTQPAPTGAAKARIQFTANVGPDARLTIDQVILAKSGTSNLVQNPSFKNGLNNWNAVNTTVETSIQAYEGNEVARVDQNGGVLFQDVPIATAAGHCFLFNCGLASSGSRFPTGNMLIKVYWLDNRGRENGLGLSLVIPGLAPENDQWLVYTGITEPAPLCTVKARVQFTKSAGGTGGVIDIDKVVLSRLV